MANDVRNGWAGCLAVWAVDCVVAQDGMLWPALAGPESLDAVPDVVALDKVPV